MEQAKIEKMLHDAKETLPTTNLEWKAPHSIESITKKKKFHVNKIAAGIAVVLLLSISGVTVLANMEIKFDTGEYGQWASHANHAGWDTCKHEMKTRGFALPEAFGQYEYETYTVLWVAKHGTTYLEALMNHVYSPIDITFDDEQKEDGYNISISVGELQEEYWSAYYEFEQVGDVWVYSDAETIFEYKGMTIYGKTVQFETAENINWRWIDEKTGLCFCVYVPIHTGMEEELDSLDVVRAVVDANR